MGVLIFRYSNEVGTEGAWGNSNFLKAHQVIPKYNYIVNPCLNMKDDIPKGLRILMTVRKMCCSELRSPLQDKACSSFYCISALCVGSKEVSEKVEWTAADQGVKEIIWDRTFSVTLIQFSLSKDVCTRVCVCSLSHSVLTFLLLFLVLLVPYPKTHC